MTVPDAPNPDAPTPDADTPALLTDWSARLSAELGIVDLEVDIDAILGLAGVAAHAIVRPAAPLTTFLVGYAAGVASADPSVSPEEAVRRAGDAARALARAADR